ncbi:hypothetical protein AB0M87_06665 [Streptomyces sp. NPDC051320]
MHAGQQLIVDLGGLNFCDSSGITVLIAARGYALPELCRRPCFHAPTAT